MPPLPPVSTMHPDFHWTGTILHAITSYYLRLTIMVSCTTNIYLTDFDFALQVLRQRSRIDLEVCVSESSNSSLCIWKAGSPTHHLWKDTAHCQTLLCSGEVSALFFCFFGGGFVAQFQTIKINVLSEHDLKSLVMNLLTCALSFWVI